MTAAARSICARRLSPGNYEVKAGGWTYSIQSVRSAYGDTQWVTDREHEDGRAETTWNQTDTLTAARAAIAAA
jgi:hypothetical protein